MCSVDPSDIRGMYLWHLRYMAALPPAAPPSSYGVNPIIQWLEDARQLQELAAQVDPDWIYFSETTDLDDEVWRYKENERGQWQTGCGTDEDSGTWDADGRWDLLREGTGVPFEVHGRFRHALSSGDHADGDGFDDPA